MKMIPANFIILLFLLLVKKNSCSEKCSSDKLHHIRLDRPGHVGRLQICWQYEPIPNHNPPTIQHYEWLNINYNNVGNVVASACSELGYSREGDKIIFPRDNFNMIFCRYRVNSIQEFRNNCYFEIFDINERTLGVICASLPSSTQPTTTPVITPTSCHRQTEVVTTTVVKMSSGCSSSYSLLNCSQNKAAHNYSSQNTGSQICSPQNSMPYTGGNNETVLGGALGGVLGALVVIVVIGLFVGLLYYRNKAYSYRMTVENTTNSQLDNPVYAAPPPLTSTSVNHQQTTPQSQDHSEMNGNYYQIEDDSDYHVQDRDYHVLEDPAQSKQRVPVINYEGFREDSVSVQSYEAPVSQS